VLERIDASGAVLRPLDDEAVREIATELRARAMEAVGVLPALVDR
jgi:N-methylhydantoinase A/oxoprolinase/acetone carboxylase beta subunit